MPRPVHSLLIAGLLSLSVGAMAQPPGPPPTGPGGPPANRADLKARLEARFDRMDANHDGKVDEKDRTARRDAAMADRFASLDTDKNGALSREEFAAARQDRARDRRDGPDGPRRFGGPGRAMMLHHGDRPMMMRGPLPFAPPPGGFAARGPDRKAGEPLTRSAFVESGLTRFDKADTNHDGTISDAERDAVRGPMRGPRGRHQSPPPPQATPSAGQ